MQGISRFSRRQKRRLLADAGDALRSAGGVRAVIGWASGSLPNLAVTSAIGLGLASGNRRLCGLRRVDFELAVGRTANPVWRLREPVMDSMLRGLLAGKMEPRRLDWQNCCQFGCSSRDDSPDREGVAKMFGVSASISPGSGVASVLRGFRPVLTFGPCFYPALRITRTRGPASNSKAQDWALAVFRPGV